MKGFMVYSLKFATIGGILLYSGCTFQLKDSFISGFGTGLAQLIIQQGFFLLNAGT